MTQKKRLSSHLEGINQMVGDIPRPLFINKNQSYVENRIKGIGYSTNCLRRHIWYVKQGNNRRADAIAVLMENGELIVTICILLMMSRWIKSIVYLSRGYDMVQVYNKNV
jgi:hypothetical protein